MLIENNSGKNLTFQTRKVSVNNYMVDSMLSAEVADGKKSNEDITFISTGLEASGIEHIADIELSFYVFDSESWETYFESDLVTIRTADGEKYDYTYDDSGDLAFENDIAKIVIKGTAEDASTFGPSIWVYIENKGESSITVQAGNTSVNGIMIDPFFACEVGVGKHAVDKLTFMSSDLEENGISEIDTVELTFKIYNSADWLNITESEPVTVKF